MAKTQDKKRKQDLGIFYTPQEVVNFVFDILKIWKNKEDNERKRWQSRKPQAHFPSVLDPACGEGVFLKTAVTSGFTGYHPTEKTPYVFGVDLDGDVVKRWEKISILHDLFKNNKDKMLNHFHQQDGLLGLPEKVFNYKTGGLKEFDAIVGNPPYGGMGFSSLKDKNTKETIEILEHLKKYEILGYRKKKNGKENGQTPLWGDFTWGSMPWGGGNRIPDTKEVESIPIEILFLDRFIQLAKPGGWIAIIIPDGILTNSNSHYVREFLSDRTKVEAIISLPRETFKKVGTNAKTSILFLRKLKEKEKLEQNYKVFLSSVEKINQDNFDLIVKSYQKLYNLGDNYMNKSDLVQITKDQAGREVVMLRADKTLKQLMEEKPYSRWSIEYWHPKYDKILIGIHKDYKVDRLGKYLTRCNQGDGLRIKKGDKYVSDGIPMISVIDIKFTGIDYSELKQIIESHYQRISSAQPKYGDILIVRSGAGSIGKSSLYLGKPAGQKIGITGHINTLGFENINSFYVEVFLKTIFGQSQIERYEGGVSGQTEFTQDSIAEIQIPIISNNIQVKIETQYKDMSKYHDLAIAAKTKKNIREYKTNLEIAEKMLKDLIVKTEEVIKGERSDVI